MPYAVLARIVYACRIAQHIGTTLKPSPHPSAVLTSSSYEVPLAPYPHVQLPGPWGHELGLSASRIYCCIVLSL